MRLFISLPWKILSLLMIFLLIASVSLTFIWIDKNNQDYQSQHQELHDRDQQQFLMIREMLSNRLTLWFESFVHLQAETDNIEATSDLLTGEFDFLQLNWQVNDLWLFDSQQRSISATSAPPNYVRQDVATTINSQSAVASIRCVSRCFQLISLPILSADGDLVVLSASTSLLEMMAALHRSTIADLAIVAAPQDTMHSDGQPIQLTELVIQPPIALANRQQLGALLKAVPEPVLVSTVQHKGYRLVLDDQVYLINLLPIDEHLDQQIYLLAIHDISAGSLRHDSYQRGVIVISVIAVIFCTLAFFILAQRLRRRLLLVAQKLPLLAEKKYSQFRALKFMQSRLLVDEIDEVQHSTNLLGAQLEEMDSKIEQNTRELENIAMYDRLTGLPNRNMLNFVLRKKIATLARLNTPLVVMLLDFDSFRKVNDSYGHGTGDEFLVAAAQRLRSSLRDSDMISRFGGDEFVIVLHEAGDLAGAIALAEKLVLTFRNSIKIGAQRFYTSISLGITTTTNASVTVDDLVRQADMAMYAAKDAGGDRHSIFNESMSKRVLRRIEIEHDAREALLQDQFKFALQPQIEICSGKLLGFEALIRWDHPKGGYILPDEFIPIMENTESMITLGYWGLARAFSILDKLDTLGVKECKIAVNLSASQFLDPQLVPFLSQQLQQYQRAAWQIELELTERTVVGDITQTLAIMHKLKDLGFSFSIDDFGTGYSSLAYLSQMPVDIIKIDRSFVSCMTDNNADKQIVKSTIAMVRKLGMKVVAEGIETGAQMRMLDQMHCQIGQGYYISRPILETDLYNVLPDKLVDGVWDNLAPKIT
jgi:diguanylate cyclase (GGDEF)-like protein